MPKKRYFDNATPKTMDRFNEDAPIDFIYEDADLHAVEMSELYSYTEENDIISNRTSFEELLKERGLPSRWTEMSQNEKLRVLDLIANGIECTKETFRWQCIRSLLYLMQGTFGECYSIQEQEINARKNTLCIYKYGLYPLVLQLLLWEFDAPPPKNLANGVTQPQQPQASTSNNTANNNNANNASNVKSNITLGDSYKLRTLLSIIYTFVEIMRVSDESDSAEDQALRVSFKQELQQPVSVSIGMSQASTVSKLFGMKAGSSPNYELLPVILFEAITRFSNGISPHYPIKKILLLLWKVILVTLGGSDELKRLKALYREEAGLKPAPDDTLEVVKNMRPVSPPLIINSSELSLHGNDVEQRRFNKQLRRSMFIKQSSVISGESEETCLLESGEGANGDDECIADEPAVVDGKEASDDSKVVVDDDMPTLLSEDIVMDDSTIESDATSESSSTTVPNGSEERSRSPSPGPAVG